MQRTSVGARVAGRFLLVLAALGAVPFASAVPVRGAEPPARLELKPHDRIVILGNTFAERMQHFGHFETLLHSRFPQHDLVVRNLGWSADEIGVRLRSQDFPDHGHKLIDHKPTVVLLCFGFNESFAGPGGVAAFQAELEAFVGRIRSLKYESLTFERGSTKGKLQGTGGSDGPAPRLALIGPIAHENLGRKELPDGSATNANLALYVAAMREVAAKTGIPFVDLLDSTRELMKSTPTGGKPLTINGIHLNEHGDRLVAGLLDEGLFGPRTKTPAPEAYEKLRAEVNEKNLQFWYDHRAVNGFYIYGGRKNPFGTVNFPAEFKKLRAMIAVRDRRVWETARGKELSPTIDDRGTGEFTVVQTNVKGDVQITSPQESLASFKLPAGYKAELFASEVEFPDLQNPVQMTFDAKGRLWVVTMPSYPMYLPGTPVDDKVLILEDTDRDGKADKQTVFASGLHLPTGLELGHGGVYVAQQPNLTFLKDTDGDDKADSREILLHGFDSADSHHSISAFTWGMGGDLYFQEGTFHHSQVETPRGPVRAANAAVFRWEPRTARFGVFVAFPFANPWGHVFDRWGQDFVADASGGANYFAAAFSGDLDFPRQHKNLKQFLVKQWRPTAGCELVSSRNFPDDVQGNYLLNNCIGFQGVLQYRMKEDGSGFSAEPVEPLLQSSDRNFRPVDLEFGPDGALYVVDWFNPLVGHMQHSLRDPHRDKSHGRIWRIRYDGRPLVEPAKIAGAPIPDLLSLLKSYEDRTRYRARIELGARPTSEVLPAVEKWIAGLDKTDPDVQHHLLEALWVQQWHDAVDVKLLKSLLRSPEPRARAAATRVLCYWRDRVDQPLELLRVQVNDEHPRVRLEAVRALSFFDSVAAIEVAAESLIHPQDDYLKYVFEETMATLEARTKPAGKK